LENAGVERADEPDALSPVDIVLFEPEYDIEERLWWVDLSVRPSSYFGYTQLGLVRYQRHSLEGLELSLVTSATYAQLLPDRMVSITRVPDDDLALAVQVFGSLQNVVETRHRNDFEIRVSKRTAMGWSTDPAVTIQPHTGSAAAIWSCRLVFSQPCGRRRLSIIEHEKGWRDGSGWAIESPEITSRIVFAETVEM
jgi:hypothetical protein